MNSNNQDIALFDFDGTISPQDSFLAFIVFTHGYLALYWGLLLHLPWIVLWRLNKYPNDRLKEKVFSYFYQGYSADRLQEHAKRFGAKIDKTCYQGALDLLDWHQQQGHQIFILTASSPLWLGDWCSQKNYQIIGTNFETADGVYTGKIAGKNCYGVEKLNRIEAVLDKTSGKVFAYGDSTSDLHYLNRAAEAYLMPLSDRNVNLFWNSKQTFPFWHDRILKWCYWLLFALLPFSLPVDIDGFAQLELPTEPLLGICSLALLGWFVRYGWWKPSFYRHPITVTSFAFIGWMVLSIPFSSDWVVSLKYTIVALTHWWVFYHGIRVVLPEGSKDFSSLLKKYCFSFTLIILYAWTVHAQYNFRIDVSVLVARPFYFDHAMYGAVLLLLVALVLGFKQKHINTYDKYYKWLFILWGILLLIGVYLSFSRAAWLSGFIALSLVGIISLFRLHFKHFVAAGLVLFVGLLFSAPLLKEKLSQNQTVSKTGSLWEQIVSTANITTDVSNLERLNRYSCAIRMTQDRPWIGFGPGTFQFAYLSYQKAEEMTRISVTTAGKHRAGKGGGAHSEYLQAFAELGIIGGILWLGLALSMLWTVLKLYQQYRKAIVLAILFGLTTFFVHALFNNFLHQAKVAVLVWSFLAMLTLTNTFTKQ